MPDFPIFDDKRPITRRHSPFTSPNISGKESSGQFLFALSQNTLLIQIVGHAVMRNCTAFGAFIEHEWKNGVTTAIADFSRCESIDSTGIGMIVRLFNIGNKDQKVLIVNMSPSIAMTLKNLGVSKFITIIEKFEIPTNMQTVELKQPKDYSSLEMLKNILKLHEALVQLDPENSGKFGKFIGMLRKELETYQSK